MRRTRAVLASFDTHEQAQACVQVLLGVGLDISFNSIAEPPSLRERIASVLSSGKSIPSWTRRGLLVGACVGFLIDTAVFPISYLGTMNVTGPLASWVVAVAEWSFVLGAVAAIVGALLVSSRRKVPVIHYQLTRECGKLLLIAFGSASVIAHAERSLMLPAGRVGVGYSNAKALVRYRQSSLKHTLKIAFDRWMSKKHVKSQIGVSGFAPRGSDDC